MLIDFSQVGLPLFNTKMSIKQQLDEILKQRIMIIDGAMGTMIQKYKLKEEDFRGDLFQDHPKDLKGDNDLLSLTRPHIIREIHEVCFIPSILNILYSRT